jgi:hypothetical protein
MYVQIFITDGGKNKSRGKIVQLKCTHCKETFSGAWDLMFHVQNAHSLNIYTLGENRVVSCTKRRFSTNVAKADKDRLTTLDLPKSALPPWLVST